MARPLAQLVQHLGRVAARGSLAHLSDRDLLGRFVAERDAAAFEILVWRHSAMVLAVCRRLLGRDADAEDAFQATFLVLVQHASTIRTRESLAGWLYRVARRVSIRAGRQRVRRADRERIAARPEAVIADDVERSDLRAHLDRAVERLPAPYREAFILCCLEGRAHEDAARELGCPLGTLQSRLARAKHQLRRWLMPAILHAFLPAAASARLVSTTVTGALELASGLVPALSPAVLTLTHGAWRPMMLTKTKFMVMAGLALAALGSGLGFSKQSAASPPAAPAAAATRATSSPAPRDPTIEELKRENARLRKEVATLKKKLAEAEAALPPKDDPPTDAEVLKALPKDAGARPRTLDDITIVKQKILDRLDTPRLVPNIGPARLRTQHWECMVYYTEHTPLPDGSELKKPRVAVLYIDKNSLVPVRGAGE